MPSRTPSPTGSSLATSSSSDPPVEALLKGGEDTLRSASPRSPPAGCGCALGQGGEAGRERLHDRRIGRCLEVVELVGIGGPVVELLLAGVVLDVQVTVGSKRAV